ncbi:class I SAM-dependent methyltransferase [Nocardia sp. CA-128927]|uniref:class I SAM-dependent methyltransferase n=1 Tax=Nocardia sp. CA-128927 TaxID=3239975 RepID=UPI003D993841
MTDSHGGLFTGTAWHYARYRPGYPKMLFDNIIERFHLNGSGRLLDLGCGTGQLAIPLARHVGEVVGVDPEAEMIAEAAAQAKRVDIANVSWVQGSSADLPGAFGRFRVVTMGRSFHWMDRETVLGVLGDMVEGGLVIANDSCLVRPNTGWQRVIEEVQRRFLPVDREDGSAKLADGRQSHEELLARSAFRDVRRTVYEFDREWTVEQAIGYLYSTSLPLRRLLDDRRIAFEQAITDALLAIDPNGRFDEPVSLEALTATRG